MKKKLTAIIAATTLIVSLSSQALGFGGVVFDPSVFARQLEQLTEAKNQVTQLQQQLSQLQSIENTMKGSSTLGSGLIPQLNDLKSITGNLTNSVTGMTGIPAGNANVQDISKMLDTVFTPDSQLPKDISKPVRYDYWQKSLKSSLELSETLINHSSAKIDKISSLAAQIDNNSTVADKLNLSNRISVESLAILQQILVLMAQLTRAESSAKYVGIYSNTQPEQSRGMRQEVMDAHTGGKPVTKKPSTISKDAEIQLKALGF